MNKRDEISNELSAYLDGELSPSRVRQIDEVLAYDKDLAGELERLKATRRLVQQLPREQAAPDFVRHVLARTERTHLLPAPTGRAYRSMRWISYAAAAVVLLAVGAAGVMIVNNGQYAKLHQGPQKLGELARAPEEKQEPAAMKTAPPSATGGVRDKEGLRTTPVADKGGVIEDLTPPAPAAVPPAPSGLAKNDLKRDAEPGGGGMPVTEPSTPMKKDRVVAAKPAALGPAEGEGTEVAAKTARHAGKGGPHKVAEGAQRVKAPNAPADAPVSESQGGMAGGAPDQHGNMAGKGAGTPPETPPVAAPGEAQQVASAITKDGKAIRGSQAKAEQAAASLEDEVVRQRGGDHSRTGPAPAGAPQSDRLPPNSVTINTSSLAVAQRDIENAMVRNGVRPLVVKQQASLGAATIGNFYQTNINNDRQVQYEAFVTADQLSRLRGELSVIRAQQDVPQVALEAPAAQQAQQAQRLEQHQDFNDRNSYDYWNNEAARAAANRLNSLNNQAQTRPGQAKGKAAQDPIANAPPMPLTQAAAAKQNETEKKESAATRPAQRDAVMKQLDEIAAAEARVLNPLNQNTLNNAAGEQTNLFRLIVTLNGKMAAGQSQFEDARAARRQAPATSAAESDMQQRNSPGLK